MLKRIKWFVILCDSCSKPISEIKVHDDVLKTPKESYCPDCIGKLQFEDKEAIVEEKKNYSKTNGAF
jgi:hypothetical protein